MGLIDEIVILDPGISCPDGHAIAQLQTKDFDPSMSTYVLTGGMLLHAIRDDQEESGRWRVADGVAIREYRYATEAVPAPRTIRAYGSCDRCAPILVRTNGRGLFGIVDEHRIDVDFDLVLRPDAPTQIVRTSGTREEQAKELLARGLYVLRDEEPLAVAHREANEARARLDALGEIHRPRRRR